VTRVQTCALPILSINKEIIKYIEAFKEDEQSHLKVTINGEEKAFDIDVSFFDN
jgi:hypothetical protein